VAERKIVEAIERGEFDNLEGKGEPLKFEDESHVPEELRMAYKVLRNAGALPPELELKREITQLEELLAGCEDEAEKYSQLKRLNFLVTKLNMTRRRPVNLEEQERYLDKVCQKLSPKSLTALSLKNSLRPGKRRR